MIDKILAIAIAIATIIVLVEIWITPPLQPQETDQDNPPSVT